eukprot:scaffold10979_cov124-Isochrysis_galbana.AAC.2
MLLPRIASVCGAAVLAACAAVAPVHADLANGAAIFDAKCVACHIQGGNILAPGRIVSQREGSDAKVPGRHSKGEPADRRGASGRRSVRVEAGEREMALIGIQAQSRCRARAWLTFSARKLALERALHRSLGERWHTCTATRLFSRPLQYILKSPNPTWEHPPLKGGSAQTSIPCKPPYRMVDGPQTPLRRSAADERGSRTHESRNDPRAHA